MSGEHSVFVYGTLMEPKVFFRVVHGTSQPSDVVRQLYTFTPAVLHGFCRHRVRGQDYPGIVPEEGQSVFGSYITGITDANLGKLDSFEGTEYDRQVVRVKQLTKVGNPSGEGQVEGEEVEAATYVFMIPNRIERGEWDFEHFRREKLHLWARDEIFFADGF